MASTSYRTRTTADETPLRRRASGLALALAIELLLLFAFLTLDFTPRATPEFEGGRLSTFDVSAESVAPEATAQEQAATATIPPPPRPVVPEVERPVPVPDVPLDLLIVTREVYIASDIAKLGRNAPGAGPALAQGSSPGDSAAGDSQRVGTGPNGEPLYAAEWYREPTGAQLAGYLPRRMPEGGGSGLVACRTADRFRVEDCVELGSTPPGSRLAAAVRQAAWQFLVRPPRVGGRTKVGEWVRIRIDYDAGDR